MFVGLIDEEAIEPWKEKYYKYPKQHYQRTIIYINHGILLKINDDA